MLIADSRAAQRAVLDEKLEGVLPDGDSLGARIDFVDGVEVVGDVIRSEYRAAEQGEIVTARLA